MRGVLRRYWYWITLILLTLLYLVWPHSIPTEFVRGVFRTVLAFLYLYLG